MNNSQRPKTVTKLGSKIRALRLGYGFSDRLKAWVRISEINKNQVGIELIPEHMMLPSSPAFGSLYFDIRQENIDRDMLPLIPCLRNKKNLKKPVTFVESITVDL